jgi:inhibitor of cysteine peptidase
LKNRRLHFALLVAIALLFPLLNRADAGVIAVTEADNGREFTLSRGDIVEVSLSATSGTGYTWQAAPIADAIVRQVGDMKFRAADNQMPGAMGHQVFRFSVEESGTGSLEFRYVRPWEKDTPPARVFKILLIVK